jgi:hypothetical protein
MMSLLILSGCVSHSFRPYGPGLCYIAECPHDGNCSKAASLALDCGLMVPFCHGEQTP